MLDNGALMGSINLEALWGIAWHQGHSTLWLGLDHEFPRKRGAVVHIDAILGFLARSKYKGAMQGLSDSARPGLEMPLQLGEILMVFSHRSHLGQSQPLHYYIIFGEMKRF